MASGPLFETRTRLFRSPPRNGADSFRNNPYAMERAGGRNVSRFGPYESYDSRSSLSERDLYRSSYGHSETEHRNFRDSFDDRYEISYRNSLESRNQGRSSWEPPYTLERLRTVYVDERGRELYSSYSTLPSPYDKPASVGSWGRGMPAIPGGRSNSAFGGPSPGRGRGRGLLGDYGSMWRHGSVGYKNTSSAGIARGVKRKKTQRPKPVELFDKKPKLSKPRGNKDPKPVPPTGPVDVVNNEEEEKLRTEARREKQRRRREKNSEKYGDGYRMAFTCAFCKFRSFEEKNIEEHLQSDSHQDILDYIQKQAKFDKSLIDFLHESIVNKYKRTAIRNTLSAQSEVLRLLEKDIMEGTTPDDHMMKVETIHCSACNVYVPALHSSVQLHLKSADHSKSKLAYKDQIKRESILTATSILNNPVVKARYELYLKGENPFEQPETEPPETEQPETEPLETEQPETEPLETEQPDTEPLETEPLETEPLETEQPATENFDDAEDFTSDTLDIPY
ncbi:DBIRD complex subunit ZNF326-like isoform 2-T2 [Discoglossus pictus]